MNRVYRLGIAMSVTMFAACSGSGGKSALRPEAQWRAMNLLERGVRAQQKSEIQQAEHFLIGALANSSSIEDNPTRIIVLINLARLNRLNSNPVIAVEYADQALHLCAEYPELLAEAAYEKAHIELDLNNHDEALSWAATSLNAESGSLKGVRRNLLARIQFTAGDTIAATLSATIARQENQCGLLPEEEANSLRILGTVELENGQLDTAKKLILEALEIDKRIGASTKIGLDLKKLAAIAERSGNLNSTAEYLERALSVHLAAGRLEKAAQILQQLSKVYDKTGNITQVEKTLQALEQLKRSKPSYPHSTAESAKPSSKP